MRGLTVALMILVNNGGEHLRPLLCSHPRSDGYLDVSQKNLHQTIGLRNICIDKLPYCIKKHKNRARVRKIICIFAPTKRKQIDISK